MGRNCHERVERIRLFLKYMKAYGQRFLDSKQKEMSPIELRAALCVVRNLAEPTKSVLHPEYAQVDPEEHEAEVTGDDLRIDVEKDE